MPKRHRSSPHPTAGTPRLSQAPIDGHTIAKLLERRQCADTVDALEPADPHCHTTASDGLATPAELVAAAVGAGLGLTAVTDHDTMAAVAETVARGEAAGLAVVAGEEVTCRWLEQIHVLGLWEG